MNESELAEVESKLGIDLPTTYREWLLKQPEQHADQDWSQLYASVGEVFITADELIDLNSTLSLGEWFDDPDEFDIDLDSCFAVAGDGCGNFFILDPEDEDSRVFFVCHDPIGCTESFPSLNDYLESIDRLLEPGAEEL